MLREPTVPTVFSFSAFSDRSPFLVLGAVLLVTLGALAGCRGNPDRNQIRDPDEAYTQAQNSMERGDFVRATQIFEQMEARFPFANATRQSQLDLMYAYYRSRQPESAIDQADQFIRENPTHPRVDYAYYIKGLVSFERNPNLIERWFNADLSERPPIDARTSFQAFQTLLQRYPKSEYATDARQRMVFLRNRLADYETYVASYYLSRGAYAGAINRAKFTLENYDGAPAIRDALGIMAEAYKSLGMTDLAADAERVLNENFASADALASERSAQRATRWWQFWN